ncbi:cytochrome c oxidase assembly protein subunit 15 [Saonia flava]|uniref:Cytochrome c oxidase assembly protein subunit 15 n=1 Tax=Saonia flava TaxID=523696 RepID=A0A846R0G8_9FLAO|nr:COX15/CtaA family protein [Saonia flava]NJB72442.1 cytochrome c oxidase assembly protein subunit 15 [Saonia flava]
MEKYYRKLIIASLILVYLVIVAGAVVRMTGSGMGCPDWPKCFGTYIPPTEVSQLEWHSNNEYKKGQVIIVGETLQVAIKDFTTLSEFNKRNWEPYTKHDYAKFNVWHTWIEYINRLLGALAGMATFIMAILSLSYWKKKKLVTILSWLVVFSMGFQGWLGATVVYSVLEPIKITLHMLMALIIVAMLLYLIYKTKNPNSTFVFHKNLRALFIGSLVITLVQIVLGTQVRQFVDEQIGSVGEHAKNLWLNKPLAQFYIHRTFSITVVVLNLYIAFLIKKRQLGYTKINWVLAILLIEVVSGIFMYYMDFPFGSQSIHMVFASLLFGVQFYLVLEASKFNKTQETL